MVIRKGSLYWIDFSPGKGSAPKGRRPGLVIQADALNDSKLNTVIVLAITSTLKFGELPGNVVLKKGEANLPKRCVVNRYIGVVDQGSGIAAPCPGKGDVHAVGSGPRDRERKPAPPCPGRTVPCERAGNRSRRLAGAWVGWRNPTFPRPGWRRRV